MTHIFTPKPGDETKWRAQAHKAAEKLKEAADTKEVVKVGFAFDDGIITVEIEGSAIRNMSVQGLGAAIYRVVKNAAANNHHGATLH